MTKDNLITAPEGTDLKKAELIFRKYKIEKLPVVNKNGNFNRPDYLPGYFTVQIIPML